MRFYWILDSSQPRAPVASWGLVLWNPPLPDDDEIALRRPGLKTLDFSIYHRDVFIGTQHQRGWIQVLGYIRSIRLDDKQEFVDEQWRFLKIAWMPKKSTSISETLPLSEPTEQCDFTSFRVFYHFLSTKFDFQHCWTEWVSACIIHGWSADWQKIGLADYKQIICRSSQRRSLNEFPWLLLSLNVFIENFQKFYEERLHWKAKNVENFICLKLLEQNKMLSHLHSCALYPLGHSEWQLSHEVPSSISFIISP